MHSSFAIILCLFLVSSLSPTLAQEEAPSSDQIISFGGDLIFPPFEWQKNGQPHGFHIELEQAIGDVGQRPIRHVSGDWPDMIEALETGQIDVLPMLISPGRKEKFLFSSAIHHISHGYYVQETASADHNIENLKDKRIAVERLSYAADKLADTDTELLLTPNTFEALQAVENGHADFAILATAIADYLIDQERLNLTRIGPPIWPQEYAFAVRRDRPELASWLQDSLNKTISNGQYQEIFSRWKDKIEPTNTSYAEALKHSAFIVAPLLLLAALGWAWSATLRRTVKARTSDLRSELSRRREAEEKLRYFANHNTQTDLPEPHHFIAQANRIFKRGNDRPQTWELGLFKLVDLEELIQTFGYRTAEQLVSAFAQRLKNSSFEIVGYLGRGNFAVLARGSTLKRVQESLVGHIQVGNLNLYPLITTGFSVWPEHGSKAGRLLRRAETALAVALATNRDMVRYDNSFEPDEISIRLVTDFRDTDAADIFPVLQPQVELKSGRIVAAEALVRWQHPELGLVSPGKFVPVLEKAGLIGKVTHRMIDEAARASKNLTAAGIECTISVNVSTQDMMADGLTDQLLDSLMRHTIDPSMIKLELTETSIAEDIERVKIILKALEGMGVKSSIDDFGTGYSSLSYLSAFPLHELKIDQSFVRGMTTNERDYNIVSSTIALGHSLGLKIVAEGAEDAAAVQALRRLGCDRVQGYVFSKPLKEKDFLNFVKTWDTHAINVM